LIANIDHTSSSGRNTGDSAMRSTAFYPPLKIFSYLVLLLMFAAIGYGAFITITNWAGIGV
jgi:hypothetical protein